MAIKRRECQRGRWVAGVSKRKAGVEVLTSNPRQGQVDGGAGAVFVGMKNWHCLLLVRAFHENHLR